MSELPLFYKVFKVIEMAGSVLKNNNKNGSCFLKVVSLNLVGHGCNAVTAGLFDGWSLGFLLSTISCWVTVGPRTRHVFMCYCYPFCLLFILICLLQMCLVENVMFHSNMSFHVKYNTLALQ